MASEIQVAADAPRGASLEDESGSPSPSSLVTAAAEEELPLTVLFARGEAAFKDLDRKINQDSVKVGIESLQAAWRAVRRLGLFSQNETKDDLTTSGLKYLLIPFYLAELLSQLQDADRGPFLQEALRNLEAFLSQCESYGLLSDACSASRLHEAEGGSDPNATRADKIARFKRNKEISTRLEAIAARRARKRRPAADAKGADGEEEEEEDEEDEETERETRMLQIDAAAIKAIDNQRTLALEAQLVERGRQMAAQAPGGPNGGPGGPGKAQGALEAGAGDGVAAELRAAMADLMKSDKARLQGQVFRPGHILPTMTVEQFGEQEYAKIVEQQKQQQRQEAAAKAARRGEEEPEEGEQAEEEETDESVRKARARDDWKDENPYGSGNSRLRPCPSYGGNR